jgi:predicted mannosyl-3-phosphoglycerate phosphatase (HAD superfamily)
MRGPRRRAAVRATSRRTTRRVIRRTRRRIIRRTVMIGGMVVIAAAGTAAAIKLSKSDAQRIEEHTGLPPEQLEDEDLNQAIQELNIQPQPLSAEDQAALTQQGAEPTPTAATPSTGSEVDYIAQLEKLAGLRDQGIITNEEFEAKKKQLLGL